MRSPTGVLTPRSVGLQRQAAQKDAENQTALANQRAARMVEVSRTGDCSHVHQLHNLTCACVQLELQRKALEPLSEEQAERRRQAAERKARGTQAVQESIDAVKHMTQLATAAQCAAVRCAFSGCEPLSPALHRRECA